MDTLDFKEALFGNLTKTIAKNPFISYDYTLFPCSIHRTHFNAQLCHLRDATLVKKSSQKFTHNLCHSDAKNTAILAMSLLDTSDEKNEN